MTIVQCPIFDYTQHRINLSMLTTGKRYNVRLLGANFYDTDNTRLIIQLRSPQLLLKGNSATQYFQVSTVDFAYQKSGSEPQFQDIQLNGFIDLQIFDVSTAALQANPSSTLPTNFKYVLITLEITETDK